MGAHPPHHVTVPLPPALYTLGQCSAAVRVALDEYEAGRCGREEAERAAFDALREERRALAVQLRARGLAVPVLLCGWPAGAAERAAVLGRLVLENQRLGARLAVALRPAAPALLS